MEGTASTHTQVDAACSEPAPPPDAERRILIVEHETESFTALQNKLSQAGFTVTTLGVDEDARVAVDRGRPHLVLLDWDLPGVIAMNLVRHVRQSACSTAPRLIALSSFASEQHVVAGFELGVDDYVIKPFSVSEVVARVRAVLRPMHTARDETIYLEFRELQMDAGECRVTIVDKTVPLRRMEFQLLQFLMRRPERAYSRETLLHHVWGSDCSAGMRSVDVTIQRIRRALAPHNCGEYLQTIRGVGYRLSAGAM
jgi:two-component system phosphate regulon response regulator PhoB